MIQLAAETSSHFVAEINGWSRPFAWTEPPLWGIHDMLASLSSDKYRPGRRPWDPQLVTFTVEQFERLRATAGPSTPLDDICTP